MQSGCAGPKAARPAGSHKRPLCRAPLRVNPATRSTSIPCGEGQQNGAGDASPLRLLLRGRCAVLVDAGAARSPHPCRAHLRLQAQVVRQARRSAARNPCLTPRSCAVARTAPPRLFDCPRPAMCCLLRSGFSRCASSAAVLAASTPSAPRGSPKSKANPPLKQKHLAFARARKPECASRKKIPNCRRCVFFDFAQSRAASRQNAFVYDGSASGALHLDTPRQITDTGGNVVWQWDNSDPFGNNVPNENPAAQGQFSFNLRFPGQYADKETNLAYNINRDYDPAIGRYTESDPIGLSGGVNTYTYVYGSPIGLIDSLGLWPNCVSAIQSITSNTYNEINKTILAQVLLPVPMPTGVGAGPNGPGKPPIGPEVEWDMWEVQYTLSRNDTYSVMQVTQHLLVTCSETRTGECGKTETYNYSYKTDNRLDPLKTLIDSQIDYNYEKIRKLFSFSTGF